MDQHLVVHCNKLFHMNKIIFTLPIASTALWKSPEFQKRLGRDCALVCNYDDEETRATTILTLVFENVEAYKTTYFKACNLEIVRNAYDRIIDCGITIWLKEIQNNLALNGSEGLNLSHLAIYFDDGPAYEFICKNFRVEKIESD